MQESVADGIQEPRRALVVGGSGGIGAAVCLRLASEGVEVFVHGGHRSDAVGGVIEACRERGVRAAGEVRAFESARDASSLPALAEEKLGGRIDTLVVAFGPYLKRALLDTGNEQWRRLVELNLLLPAMLVTWFLPRMTAAGDGRILLFGAPKAETNPGFHEIGAYAAAKAGLVSLVRSVAKQYGAKGVRANLIAPGYVDTEYLSEAERQTAKRRAPGATLITPQSIAGLAWHLLSSSAVNGAVIPADGGL